MRSSYQYQGLFQLFWEKAPGLNWEKNMRHFGNFLGVLNSKKQNKKYT